MQQNRQTYLKKELSPSREEYLKTIYKLSQRTEMVRSIDIALYLGVSKPSVHRAVTKLQEVGMVTKPLRRQIQLTEKGRKKGENLASKFNVIRQFLVSCCHVNEETASADACKIEHILSEESVLALKKFLKM